MRNSHMELECSKVKDQCIISSSNMLHMVSKDNNSKASKELKIRAKGGPNRHQENPKYCMEITLKSGRELENIKEKKKK